MKIKVNKKIAIVTGCLLAVAAGVTIAYLTAGRRLVNKFTVGENTIKVVEEFEPPKKLDKGLNTFTKKVQVENTGTTDAFVRVYAAFSDSDVAKNSFVAASKPRSVTIADDDTLESVTSKMKSAGYKTTEDFWAENGPSNNWVYIPEDGDSELGGYFYYTKSVAPGKDTEDLMNTVTTYFASADDVKDYEIIVYAESVQTKDKDGNQYDDSNYQTAWETFLTRKDTANN